MAKDKTAEIAAMLRELANEVESGGATFHGLEMLPGLIGAKSFTVKFTIAPPGFKFNEGAIQPKEETPFFQTHIQGEWVGGVDLDKSQMKPVGKKKKAIGSLKEQAATFEPMPFIDSPNGPIEYISNSVIEEATKEMLKPKPSMPFIKDGSVSGIKMNSEGMGPDYDYNKLYKLLEDYVGQPATPHILMSIKKHIQKELNLIVKEVSFDTVNNYLNVTIDKSAVKVISLAYPKWFDKYPKLTEELKSMVGKTYEITIAQSLATSSLSWYLGKFGADNLQVLMNNGHIQISEKSLLSAP